MTERTRALFGSRRVQVIGGSLALLLVGAALGAGVTMGLPALAASNPSTPTPKSADAQKYCTTYEQKLASELGVSTDKLEQANKDALKAAAEQAVTDGKLTRSQADQIEQQLAQNGSNVCAHLGDVVGKHGIGGPGGPGDLGALSQARQAVVDAVAAKLNVSSSDLESAVHGGTDIVTYAGQHNVDKATLNQTITDAVKAQVDKAQQAGNLTADQATALNDKVSQAINAGHYEIVGLGSFRGFGGFGPGKPGGQQPQTGTSTN